MMIRGESRYTAVPGLLAHGSRQDTADMCRSIPIAKRLVQRERLPWEISRRGVLAGLAVVGLILIMDTRAYPIVGGSDPIFLYVLSVVGLLALGLILSMTMTARRVASTISHWETKTETLYSFTTSLSGASSLDEVMEAIGSHIPKIFHRPIVILLPQDQGLKERFCSPGVILDDREREAAEWVFRTGDEAGNSTDRFSGATLLYRPLITFQGVVGVFGIPADGATDLLDGEQRQLFGTFVSQAALAITRADLAAKALQSEILLGTDKLHKALLNSISHNLRTPITSVAGVLQNLLEDGHLFDPTTRQHLLETALNEALRLDRLVQNLLDMSRLEGGVIHIKTVFCDVHDVIGAALEQIGEQARRRAVSIAIDPGLPLVPMDHVLIVQVLVNLIDNAFKYSPPDEPIRITAQQIDGHVKVSIADCGIGIPEQELERVFDKFFRSASSDVHCGAGLGLAICKGFIEAHHGRVWANRRPNGGTEMTFLLPCEVKR
jgi:two-component system sensor histidine kinase KdpD